MAKKKIPKNLTDAQMLKKAKSETSFETEIHPDETPTSRHTPAAQVTEKSFRRGFLTPEIEQRLGELLLEIKMDYYKDEIVDFSIEVRKEGRNIIIETAPKKHQQRI